MIYMMPLITYKSAYDRIYRTGQREGVTARTGMGGGWRMTCAVKEGGKIDPPGRRDSPVGGRFLPAPGTCPEKNIP